jgi:acyl carrier protein
MNVKKEFLDILQDYVEFPVEEIHTDEPFKTASGVDSFVFIEMISSVEDHFGIRVPNADLVNFKTIDDIVGYIEKKAA